LGAIITPVPADVTITVPDCEIRCETVSVESSVAQATDPTDVEVVEISCVSADTSCDEVVHVKEAPPRITGAIETYNAYVFRDGSTATDRPVAQAWLSVDIGQGFSLETFGSKGLDQNVGDEFDIGIMYQRDLGAGFTGRLIFNHYFLFGNVPDMQEVTAEVEKDGFRVRATYNPWGGGLEDGFILGAGYDFNLTPRLSGRADVLYVTGYGATDAVVGSVGLRYDLGGGLTAMVDAYVPSREDQFSTTRIVLGFGIKL
jgi:hypothetical protein